MSLESSLVHVCFPQRSKMTVSTTTLLFTSKSAQSFIASGRFALKCQECSPACTYWSGRTSLFLICRLSRRLFLKGQSSSISLHFVLGAFEALLWFSFYVSKSHLAWAWICAFSTFKQRIRWTDISCCSVFTAVLWLLTERFNLRVSRVLTSKCAQMILIELWWA